MSGHVSGVQQRIREHQPRALFTHCRSHTLNLVVVHGCSDVPLIRNTKATIEKIAVFFSASAVRKDILQEDPQENEETQASKKRKIGGIPLMSDTRWGSRGKTVGAFIEHFKAAHSALTDMESGTSSNASKASNLKHSIESFDTIVSAVPTNKILGYIQPLTNQLQSTNIDLMTAYKEAREVAQVISLLRNEESFKEVYEKSEQLASTIGVVPVKKRVTNKQQLRANAPSESIEEHYRVNLFYPFVDHVISQVNTRFMEGSEPAMLATYLIPSSLSKLTKEKQKIMLSCYRKDLLSLTLLTRRFKDGKSRNKLQKSWNPQL